jgi:hypothetical protein
MNQLSPVVSAVTDAIATCVWLIGQFNMKGLAHPAVFAKLFERLRRQLPPPFSARLPPRAGFRALPARDGSRARPSDTASRFALLLRPGRVPWRKKLPGLAA